MAEEPEEDQRALHAKIFGDDDSDAEDEEYVAPVEETSGKKRLQKTKPSSSKKRRSAPDADTMAAEGARLEAEDDARKRGKEKKENKDDDPDDDSVDGEEAIEAGGKKDVERMLGRKTRGGKKDYSRQECNDVTTEILERMEKAADLDEDALAETPPRPAIAKTQMMPEVQEFMRKRQYHETMIDNGFLSTLARWLKPTNDGSLVSLTVRTGVLKSLDLIEVCG